MSTPPRSPSGSTYSLPHSPSTVRRRSQAHESMNNPTSPHHLQQRPLPPSQPFPRPRALPSSIPSPSSSARSSTFLLDSSQMVASPSSSRFGSMPMRRPPMNPLVSRLRSISATPSQSFRGVRSSSQASSLASLAIQDTEGLHGFADDSHAYSLDQSLILSSNNNGHVPISNGSRRSSTSNLKTVARGGFDMSPSASSNAQNGDDAEATLLHPERRKGSHLPTAHELVPPLKWTVLKRLSQRLFSDPLNNGKSSSSLADAGSPTCLAVAGGLIVIGTSKGWTMVYDYSQSLKAIAGNDDISKQCGEVTALALSQDATFIAVAYRSAHIHLYEWGRKPGTPARTVQPTTLQAINSGKAEGHLAKDASGSGSVIWHLGFVGRRHTAIVSGDHYGLAFYHSLGKVLGLANTDILRILGKYPFDLGPGLRTGLDGEAVTPLPPSRLLGVQSLPLGTEEHWVDEFNLIALLTGGKLVIAGLKPTPRTWWRYVNHTRSSQNDLNTHAFSSQSSEADEDMLHHGNGDKDTESQSGCLAWLPSIDGSSPLLAWCWQGALRIAKVEPGHSGQSSALRAAPPRESRKSDALRPAQNGMSDTRITPTFQVLTRKLRAKESHAKQAVNTSEVLTICDETMKALQWLNKRVGPLLKSLTTSR